MFNVWLPHSPSQYIGQMAGLGDCPPGEIASDVGGDNPVCLTEEEWRAFESSQHQPPAVQVKPQAKDAWTNYLIYGFAALLIFGVVAGGRR